MSTNTRKVEKLERKALAILGPVIVKAHKELVRYEKRARKRFKKLMRKKPEPGATVTIKRPFRNSSASA